MVIETVSGVRMNRSPAVETFLFDFGKVAEAYEYDWTRQDSFARRAEWLNNGGYRGDRAAVATALERYNRALGADETVLANIDVLRRDGTLTVVTGQQAGIFTGAAYAIYKAMTAIHLARQQSERLGVPVVPVFWIAGEDHDWYEVASVEVPVSDGLTRIQLKEDFSQERRSVGLAPVPDSLAEVLDEFESLMPETEFKAEVLERIRTFASDGPALDPALTGGKPSLADWFGRLMLWLFRGTGLILLNSCDPALRRAEAGFFARAVQRQAAVEEALGRGHDRWVALGFEPTVDWHEGHLNLFTYVDGERLPIMGFGDRLWVRDHNEIAWFREELVDLVQTAPERFSTNVVLRPVVQGAILPDLATVCGPGEIHYFGLFREVFRALDSQMPIIYPRESYTLVEPPIARILQKREMTLEDVFFRLKEKREELLEREDRLGITGLFADFRTAFGQRYDQLVEKLLLLDHNLQYVIEENRKQIHVQINKLEEKARQQHRKNCEVGMRQFDRLWGHITPHDGLQERVVSILPYLVKYGPDLVQRLLARTDVGESWAHRAVYLGG